MDINSFISTLSLLGIIMLVFRVITLQENMKNMQHRLDRIASHLELPEDPVNDELRGLLKNGEEIQAVKIARETLGLSLLEGKQYVDGLKSKDT